MIVLPNRSVDFVLALLSILATTCLTFAQDPGTRCPEPLTTDHQSTSNASPSIPRAALSKQEPHPEPSVDELRLFDGKSLNGWEKTNFGGEQDVQVIDGVMIIEAGYPLTGITSTREDLPKSNYELRLKAKRIEGTDFFCCLTFPVTDSHLSLVVGGWGGTLVGLSCLDDQDAAHNETAVHKNFEPDRWYEIRVQVTDSRVTAWIEQEKVIDVDISDRKLSLRNEVLANRPLGICTFETTAGLKDLILRRISKTPEADKLEPDGGNDEGAVEHAK